MASWIMDWINWKYLANETNDNLSAGKFNFRIILNGMNRLLNKNVFFYRSRSNNCLYKDFLVTNLHCVPINDNICFIYRGRSSPALRFGLKQSLKISPIHIKQITRNRVNQPDRRISTWPVGCAQSKTMISFRWNESH